MVGQLAKKNVNLQVNYSINNPQLIYQDNNIY